MGLGVIHTHIDASKDKKVACEALFFNFFLGYFYIQYPIKDKIPHKIR